MIFSPCGCVCFVVARDWHNILVDLAVQCAIIFCAFCEAKNWWEIPLEEEEVPLSDYGYWRRLVLEKCVWNVVNEWSYRTPAKPRR